MLKNNPFKACLLIPAIVFCLNLSGFSSDQCIPPDCPPNISTIQGTVEYPAGWLLEWDPNNPNEIARNSCSEIKVIGRKWSRYQWYLNGNGFSLMQLETAEPSNTLCADGTTCGPATISVTGENADGEQVANTVEEAIYVYGSGHWEPVSSEGKFVGEYGQKIEDGLKIEEWWCTSCSTDDCTEIYESIDPATGEIACLENCGNFECEGVIRTARYFKAKSQAEAAVEAFMASTNYGPNSWSWDFCFLANTPWRNYSYVRIPCSPGAYPEKDCIPFLYLFDPSNDICENKLDGELTPDDIAVNSNCPDSTEYCATNGKKVWEWICD